MKAYEFPARITPDGKIEVPKSLLNALRTDHPIRTILLLSEPSDAEEERAWSRMAAEQFVAGYTETDAVYDGI